MSTNRQDDELVSATLLDDEDIQVVASGSEGGLSAGLLCLSDKRLLFVRSRALGRPVVVSIALDEIDDVAIRERPMTAVLSVAAAAGSFSWDVTPKMRTWNLFWPIKGRVDAEAP